MDRATVPGTTASSKIRLIVYTQHLIKIMGKTCPCHNLTTKLLTAEEIRCIFDDI